MATVKEHYDQVLSEVYVWMLGGFDSGLKNNAAFFAKHNIKPARSGLAVDLGAGCGFQSIPLAKAGFSVLAMDLDAKLLKELSVHSGGLAVKIVQDDLIDFNKYLKDSAELVVCMTDTLLHLESKDRVVSLFHKVFSALEHGGKFIITFRDLTYELADLDRFIPVKSDANIIFTCFLEYEPETVKVHDLVYKRTDEKWRLNKSYYRKLRLSKEWVEEGLSSAGFSRIQASLDSGLVTVIAAK